MRDTAGTLRKLTILFALIVLLLPGAPPAVAADAPAAVPAEMGGVHPAPALSGLPGYRALAARYPESDAVVLFDSLFITLDGENRISRRRHRAVMLFTDNAINRYGDPRILFDTAAQDLTVIAARVYMRDGTIVDTQKNGINQTTPFALELAPDYADWQETVVTHCGIEKGCVAELHYVIRDKSPSPWLSGVEIFSSEDPVQVRALEIRLPDSAVLKSASWNGAPALEQSADGVWRCAVHDIAGRTPQDGGAWEGDYRPILCYSTAASWSAVQAAIAAEVIENSREAGFLARVVAEKLKDLRSDEERILKIHGLALESVTGVHAPFGLFASPARDAKRIYETGYASALDRAVLLAAMLRAAGYEPVPVLASSGKAWTDAVGAPEIFKTVMISVAAGGNEDLLLDPEMPFEHDPALTLAGRTLVFLDQKGAITHLASRSADESRSALDLALAPGTDRSSLEGRGVARLTGIFSPYYLMRGTGTEAEDFVKTRVNRLFEGAQFTSWNPIKLERDAAEFAFDFTVKLPEKKTGERVYLALPKPFETALSGIDRVHLERSSAADAIKAGPCTLDVSCAIDAPRGWKIISLPQPSDERNEIGSVRVALESTPEGKNVCRRSLMLQGDLVRPVEYAMLRSLLLKLGDDRLVLEKE